MNKSGRTGFFVGNFVRSLGVAKARTGQRMTNEHLAIADAVAARDPDAARAAMLTHIDGSERRVFKGGTMTVTVECVAPTRSQLGEGAVWGRGRRAAVVGGTSPPG